MSRCRLGNRRGATLVEAALILLMFMMIVIGTMEFGRIVWIYDTISYVAREGSRYASVRGSAAPATATEQDIRQAVLREAIGLDPAALTVAVAWNPNKDPTSTVSVTVAYSVTSLVPWIPAPTIRARSQMVISQ
jgi:Flp pilus assembly protein TadG